MALSLYHRNGQHGPRCQASTCQSPMLLAWNQVPPQAPDRNIEGWCQMKVSGDSLLKDGKNPGGDCCWVGVVPTYRDNADNTQIPSTHIQGPKFPTFILCHSKQGNVYSLYSQWIQPCASEQWITGYNWYILLKGDEICYPITIHRKTPLSRKIFLSQVPNNYCIDSIPEVSKKIATVHRIWFN